MATIKVYGSQLSPFVRKVLIALKLKGLAFENDAVMPGSAPRDISPLGKIPALQDGDARMCDSSVILAYLEEQYPETSLLPASPAERARARWFEEYGDTKVIEMCGPGIFFERMVKPVLLQQETDEAKVQDTIDNKLPPVLDYLESQVPAEGFMFAGDLGLADISLVSPFINAEYADYRVDAIKWPKLVAYQTRVKAHPVVADQLVQDQELLALLTGK